jgi:hypothetical protein
VFYPDGDPTVYDPRTGRMARDYRPLPGLWSRTRMGQVRRDYNDLSNCLPPAWPVAFDLVSRNVQRRWDP